MLAGLLTEIQPVVLVVVSPSETCPFQQASHHGDHAACFVRWMKFDCSRPGCGFSSSQPSSSPAAKFLPRLPRPCRQGHAEATSNYQLPAAHGSKHASSLDRVHRCHWRRNGGDGRENQSYFVATPSRAFPVGSGHQNILNPTMKRIFGPQGLPNCAEFCLMVYHGPIVAIKGEVERVSMLLSHRSSGLGWTDGVSAMISSNSMEVENETNSQESSHKGIYNIRMYTRLQ